MASEFGIADAKPAKAAEGGTRPQEAKTSPSSAIHIVKKGETISKIASNYGVKYEDLVKLNGIRDPKKIQEGQTLKIPRKN